MMDDLARNGEGVETLPSRRERHQHLRRSRKRKGARLLIVNESSGVQNEPTDKSHVGQTEETATLKEEGATGPERSEIFKEKRDRQGSLFVTGTIFWSFMILVGYLLFFTIRHYS